MAGPETISQKVRLECSTAAVEATYVYDVVKQYLYPKLFFGNKVAWRMQVNV